MQPAARALEAGLGFTAYPSVPPWPVGLPQDDAIDTIFGYLSSATTRDEICAVAEEVRPDAMVVDGFMLAAYDAADRLGLPTAALCHCSYALFAGPWGERVMGVPVADLFDRVDRVLVPTHPAYEGIEAVPPNVDFIGAIKAVAEICGRAPGKPTTCRPWSAQHEHDQPGSVGRLARTARRPQPSAGAGAAHPGRGTRSRERRCACERPGARLRRSQSCVLPHVDGFVTHAGMSGIATALSFGRPLVCLPQGRDQGFNAARVAELGAGISLAAGASPEVVAGAAARVLADPSYAAVARRFAAPGGARDPVEAALALLEPARGTASR